MVTKLQVIAENFRKIRGVTFLPCWSLPQSMAQDTRLTLMVTLRTGAALRSRCPALLRRNRSGQRAIGDVAADNVVAVTLHLATIGRLPTRSVGSDGRLADAHHG